MPASQLVHVEALVLALYVPGLQAVGVAEPVEQKDPAGQATQSVEAVITERDASWYLPAGQGSGALQPVAQ